MFILDGIVGMYKLYILGGTVGDIYVRLFNIYTLYVLVLIELCRIATNSRGGGRGGSDADSDDEDNDNDSSYLPERRGD